MDEYIDDGARVRKQRNLIVYRFGLIGAGVSLFLITNIVRYIRHPSYLHDPSEAFQVLISLCVYLMGGFIWGLVMWSFLRRLQSYGAK